MQISIKRALAIPAILALAATTAFLAAAPARAADATYCGEEEIKDTTIAGDLIVPATFLGPTCIISNVTVQGALILEGHFSDSSRAEFNGGEIRGGIQAGEYSQLAVRDATIKRGITADDAYTVEVRNSTVFGDFAGEGINNGGGRGYTHEGFGLIDSRMYGDIITTGDDRNLMITIDRSSLTGNINTVQSANHLLDSTIRGNISVTRGSSGGSYDHSFTYSAYNLVCDSKIYGDARWDKTEGYEYGQEGTPEDLGLRIGGYYHPGWCGPSYFSKDVTITNATGRVGVYNAVIEGKLSGTGNAYTPWGDRNEVRGGIEGQFTEMTLPNYDNGR